MVQVQTQRERERRRYQALSVIAARGAEYLGSMFSKKSAPPIYEIFPFWTEEEKQEAKVAKYRRIMERYAGQQNGGG